MFILNIRFLFNHVSIINFDRCKMNQNQSDYISQPSMIQMGNEKCGHGYVKKELHKSLLSISNSRIIVGEHFRWKYILFGNRYLSVSLLVPRRNRKILEDDSTCSNRIPGFKHEASFPLSSKNPVEQKAESYLFFSLLFEKVEKRSAHTHTHTHTCILIQGENKRQKNEAACRFSESQPYLKPL